MKRWLAPLALVALVSVAGGCGGGDDNSAASSDDTEATDTSSTGSESTDTASGDTNTKSDAATDDTVAKPSTGKGFGCKVTATGGIEASFTSPDSLSSFSSDYYFSKAEIDRANGMFSDVATDVLSDMFTDLSDNTDPGYTMPPRPEGAAPFLGWFLLNCESDALSISLMASGDSTSDQIPFGPGTYDIVAGSLLGGNEPGKFSVLVNDKRDGGPLWSAGEGATIVIERFDGRGAAGSFTIPLEESAFGSTNATPATAQITGTFEVTCNSGDHCDN